ncbi:hypothetical protein G7062_10060 [Erysipelothrix sp. HDW6C]|uniref:metallophosphoesterase n=1 Tax=Erysipelothrix sp. HDW6C TaxID=2714930 RepID=UPI001407E98A|nr:metallophosphoesterase [Erysipelothrix sp. HDW6C]QIK70625.1 hypothetical protein G7062_10060 [Erysipelothrix sp. HDW6C]
MKIYATSDIHGYNTERLDVLLERDFENTILIDNGDFFIGSPHATYWNHQAGENQLVKIANTIKFDAMVPGNHDFDYGLDFYLDRVSELDMPVIACNIFDNQDNHLFEPYTIITKGKQRIAIIGAVTSNLSQLTSFANTKDLRCQSAPQWIAKYVEALRDTVDVIVVSYHGGIECDLSTGHETQYQTGEDEAYKIARSITGIDILICGHQHRENSGYVKDCHVIQVPDRLKKIAEITSHAPYALSWVIPQSRIREDEAYNKWLESTVDTRHLEAFVRQFLNGDVYDFELEDNTVQAMITAFSSVYPMRAYTYNGFELASFPWCTVRDDACIVTNRQLDAYRLSAFTVANIFDLYYHHVFKP